MAQCTNCGYQLPPDLKFCPQCATPVEGKPARVETPQWEYCEIVYWQREDRPASWLRPFTAPKFSIVFWAKGVGPQGEFTVETSENSIPERHDKNIGSANGLYFYQPGYEYRPYEVPECIDLVNALIRELTSKGWEYATLTYQGAEGFGDPYYFLVFYKISSSLSYKIERDKNRGEKSLMDARRRTMDKSGRAISSKMAKQTKACKATAVKHAGRPSRKPRARCFTAVAIQQRRWWNVWPC